MNAYVHAVPNFSEGRDDEIIKKIVGQLQGKQGVKLIDFYPD
ncbi:MAG: glutamate formimidoyltransferase, partial [Deltaproteobacteria bacterium]|nr:glutamate formimidoyltransferase [Deltaproteobacteria bacterium]